MQIETMDIAARGMGFDALVCGPEDGELVLLLHGFPQTAACWRPALNELGAAGYRAVAVNQRGYADGARPAGVAAYRLEELTEDGRALIAALGHTRAHIIGHDWGGTVAWALAANEAAWVASLTVLSTPHTAALRDALRHWEQRSRMLYIPVLRLPLLAESAFLLLDGRLVVEALVRTGLQRATARRDVQHLRRVGPGGALNWYRAIGQSALRSGPVEVPTMYVWSDGDPAFSRGAAERTERYVRGPYHVVDLEGATHWIPDQHWNEIGDLVIAHLRDA